VSDAPDGCRFRDDAGPWVLGALAEPEAAAFAAHLEACDGCRREVAELQVVADVLPMAAPQVAPPPELKRRIMAVVESEAQLLRAAGPEADRVAPPRPRRERRRWGGWPAPLARLRPIPAALLASALLAVGVAGGILVSGGDDTTTTKGFGPRGTQVALHVTGDHGTLDLSGMPAPPPGRVYQVWLVHGNEKPRPTHTLFTVPRDGRAEVDIMESLKDTDKVLVTDEPRGGSRQPTTEPIVGATVT
jgi:anti-sigma-K factor RskA